MDRNSIARVCRTFYEFGRWWGYYITCSYFDRLISNGTYTLYILYVCGAVIGNNNYVESQTGIGGFRVETFVLISIYALSIF